MPVPLPQSIQREWMATDYRVRLPFGGYASIRCGRPLPEALRPLLTAGEEPWGFITAWNPASCAQPRAVNRRLQRQLRDALRASGHRFRAGAGVGTDGWREPSLFVPGIDFPRLDALARQFHQLGIVRGVGAGIAELHELA
jgi:Protein of unknown function (DUF3293)